jgi:hypothetical protein
MGHFEPAGIRPLTRAYGAGMAMQQDSHRHSPRLKNALHFLVNQL